MGSTEFRRTLLGLESLLKYPSLPIFSDGVGEGEITRGVAGSCDCEAAMCIVGSTRQDVDLVSRGS